MVNLKDQRIGMLTVISKGSKNNQGNYRWWCQCACGSPLKEISGSHLQRKDIKSCGCLIYKRPWEWLYNYMCKMAAKKNNKMLITYEQFLEFVKIDKCFYCGDAIIWSKHSKSTHNPISRRTAPLRYNLDRIDNKRGYTMENCVVCCPTCNYIKGGKTMPEFVEYLKHCKKICDKHAN